MAYQQRDHLRPSKKEGETKRNKKMEDKEGTKFDMIVDYMQRLLAIVRNADNVQNHFQKLKDLQQEINVLRNKQQQQIKDVIQGLQEEIESAEVASQGEEATVVRTEEVAFHSELSKRRDNLEKVKQKYEDFKQKASQCRKEENRLAQEREKVTTQTTKSLPNARYDVNLYRNITKIRWQFDCEPDEINGFVCNKEDVKPFSLKSKQVSNFFIANYLWDLIEEDW